MTDQETPATLANGLPVPPIPQRLRELLKDYPDHLALIQQDLNYVVLDHAKSIPLFEQALWILEGRTSVFIREAVTELDVAKASGDAEAIASAEAKEELMFRSGDINNGLKGLHELWDYFEANKGYLK